MIVQFEFVKSKDRFINDFYKYVKDTEPFQFKEKDYLNLMETKEIDYFKVTAKHTYIDKDIYFKFDVKDFEESNGTKYRLYCYDKVYFK